jgi:hypothetical protein
MILTQSNFSDMPKVHSPLVREETDDGYLVTDEINTDDEGNSYAWVFEDPRTMAVEKLHGTNVSVKVQDGQVSAVWNRENRIPLIPQHTNQRRIISGVQNSVVRGYVDRLEDGQVFGELLGPKINGNHYDLEDHIWIPFASYGQRHLQYKSFGKYGTDPEDIRGWFSEGLIPLFYSRWHDMSFQEAEGAFVEGIMFTHPEPEEIDTLPYAKLRRDMYPFYDGPQIH